MPKGDTGPGKAGPPSGAQKCPKDNPYNLPKSESVTCRVVPWEGGVCDILLTAEDDHTGKGCGTDCGQRLALTRNGTLTTTLGIS